MVALRTLDLAAPSAATRGGAGVLLLGETRGGPAGAGDAAAAAGAGASAAGSEVSSSKAETPPPLDTTSRSMSVRDASSTLMNLTPMPAGLSGPEPAASRFHTTRPTPCNIALSSAIRISNFSSVPGKNGDGVLMKMPPRLTSCE